MKKSIIMCFILILVLTGCKSKDDEKDTKKTQDTKTQMSTSEITEETTEETTEDTKEEITKETTEQEISTEVIGDENIEENNSEEISVSILSESSKQFEFSSGAGAWGTFLEIETDGTFKGDYHDTNMGETGDDYPDGTIYYCNFTGKFSIPEKIDEYSYLMRLESIALDGTDGEESIENGVRYVYSVPYGLENVDEIIIYLPGYKVSDLPEEFVEWSDLNYRDPKPEVLPYFGLYNVTEQKGFIEILD